MSWLQLTLTILTVMALSAGQVLFKLASEDLKLSVSGLLPSLLSTKLILALFIYGVATVMWLVVLKIAPLRIAYPDRKSTRLNSSHVRISYAVFCLKKKKNP